MQQAQAVRRASGIANIDFHKGQTLLRLAGTYPTLQQSIKEQIQNALDSDATHIAVCISMKTRNYVVLDNGTGASVEKFHEALRSVGQSIKARDKLGRFGLGLISPLGKCERFTFTSCPQPSRGPFTEWRLVTADIAQQANDVCIPVRKRADLIFCSTPTRLDRGMTGVWWRTEVAVYRFTEDRMLSALTLEGLEQEIMNDFSEVMYRRKVAIAIELVDENGAGDKRVVKAGRFRGKPLPPVTYHGEHGGTTQLTMYAVRAKDRRLSHLNIRFGELFNAFRFSLKNFLRFNGDLLEPETVEALKSGVFEGEILSERSVLTPQRTCFEKNDAVVDFCKAIDRWYLEYGKKRLDEERVRQSEIRYQELGLRSMRVLEDLLKLPEHSQLLEAMKQNFRFGTVGVGHAAPPRNAANGYMDDTAVSLRGGVGVEREERATGDKSYGSSGKPREKVERPGHVPLSVVGPRGQMRRLVKGNSIGLQFDYQDLGASPALWDLDCTTAVLTFNITHPLWVECDKEKRDWKVCALQEFVAMQALTLESMPNREWYQHQRLVADAIVRNYVKLLSVGAISRSRKSTVE